VLDVYNGNNEFSKERAPGNVRCNTVILIIVSLLIIFYVCNSFQTPFLRQYFETVGMWKTCSTNPQRFRQMKNRGGTTRPRFA